MYSLEQASWTGPRLLDGHDQHGVDAPFDVPSTYYKVCIAYRNDCEDARRNFSLHWRTTFAFTRIADSRLSGCSCQNR